MTSGYRSDSQSRTQKHLHHHAVSPHGTGVLITGPDDGTKTSLVCQWADEGKIQMAGGMNIGIHVMRMRSNGGMLWSINGVDSAHGVVNLVKQFCSNVGTIMFVMDASDDTELDTIRSKLHELLTIKTLHPLRLILVANEKAVEGHQRMKSALIALRLELHHLPQKHEIIKVDVYNSKGLSKLYAAISQKPSHHSPRSPRHKHHHSSSAHSPQRSHHQSAHSHSDRRRMSH
eukprot:gnl/TRDRNA2_/TRDRNA2_142433_c0_seq1.p1 gnl/TRDRNA2_/TRDRNA2_142433_c0~~gnl/TRDRNA2_/TRDRNA2_142433_c0_seq1.p1  ORF type:complete len:231 (+),score=24.41 gnl/TRDRNA2_/TRDRNA2_142433_c0_seq1:133-825(+)